MASDTYDSVTTELSLGAGTYTASSHGTQQVSGIDGQLQPGASAFSGTTVSGEFFVETQSLDVTYARQPVANMWGQQAGHSLTLSSYTASGGVTDTSLAVLVQADYSVEKVTGRFYTSSFVQTQKFEVNALSSLNGNNYGPSSPTTSPFQLGPAGSILTKQQWYNRRPWNNGTDQTVTSSIFVSNYAYASSGTHAAAQINWARNPQTTYYTLHEAHFADPTWKYSPIQVWDAYQGLGINNGLYRLPGPYSLSQENSNTQIWRALDTIGRLVADSARGMVRVPPIHSEGQTFVNAKDKLSIPQYSIARHDYS